MRYFILIAVITVQSVFTGAISQIVVRDHRTDKTKWVPRPRPTIPVNPGPDDRETIPVNISSFRVDPQYRQEIKLKNNDWGVLANNPYQVVFCSKLLIDNANLSTADNGPRKDLLLYADTVEITGGTSSIDLSRNNANENGFLMISCRLLNVNSGILNVNLGKNETGKWRKFFLFTEQGLLMGKKPMNERDPITRGVVVNKYRSGHWEHLRAGEKETAPPGQAIRPGYKWKSTEFDPLFASVGLLTTMIETNEWFYNFFSRWVAASYQNLYNRILRDANGFDRMQAVRDFVLFVALNSYNQLEPSAKAQSTQWIEKIATYKSEIFKNGFQFERVFTVEGRPISLIGAITENGIVYYLPPVSSAINVSRVNGKTIYGYRVFDDTQPNLSTIDFDIVFITDTRLKTKLETEYLLFNESIGNSTEEMQLTNMTVTGPDIIANQTKITPLSNNSYNIRLAVNNGSIILFNRLFSSISSDIFLVGKWGNQNSTIMGDARVPLTFTRQQIPQLEMKDRTITNTSSATAVVEFYLVDKYLMELSPALEIQPGASLKEAFFGADNKVKLPADGAYFKLNPEKFGDYFEQIDNSDKLTQDLYVENHLAPNAQDSTGYLKYVELVIDYNSGGKTYQRKIQLAPGNTMGSSYKLLLPKSNKDPVPVVISGRAYYEFAEYDIVEVKLDNAESRFDLQESNLKNK